MVLASWRVPGGTCAQHHLAKLIPTKTYVDTYKGYRIVLPLARESSARVAQTRSVVLPACKIDTQKNIHALSGQDSLAKHQAARK